MKVFPRREILQVIVLFVRPADQILAAFKSFVDQQDRPVAIFLEVLRPLNPNRPQNIPPET